MDKYEYKSVESMRKLVPVLILLLFVLMAFISPVGPKTSGSVAASGPSSCPSNEVFHVAWAGGPATSFNFLTAGQFPNFFIARMMYESFSPFYFTNGSADWSNAITDWISSNSNYTQWEFNVKPGVYWSNGQAVNASDILNTYSSSFALNATVDVFDLRSEIINSYALNSTTAVFVLNQSDAHFPEIAGGTDLTGVYPSSFIARGATYSGIGPNPTTLIGDGPFYAYGYSTSQTQLIMLRNPYYTPQPGICEIIMNLLESNTQAPSYLSSNTADFAQITPGSAASVLNNTNIRVNVEPSIGSLFMEYNTSVFPFSQLAFRQALVYGVNQSAIQQHAYAGYFTTGYTSEGTVPPQVSAYYNPDQVTNYSYSQTIALSKLASIGITKQSDGYLHYNNGTIVSLTVATPNHYGAEVLANGVVVTDLEALGFKVTVVIGSQGQIVGDSFSGQETDWIFLAQAGGNVYGVAYLDSLPATNLYSSFAPYPAYGKYSANGMLLAEPTPQSQAEYQSNYSAIRATANPALEAQYLKNIQLITSQQLPIILLGYPSVVFAYNTQSWVNWPTNFIVGLQSAFNNLGFANIQPAGITSTTSSISTTSTTSTTSGGSSVAMSWSIVIIVMTVLLAAAAMIVVRRRPISHQSS